MSTAQAALARGPRGWGGRTLLSHVVQISVESLLKNFSLKTLFIKIFMFAFCTLSHLMPVRDGRVPGAEPFVPRGGSSKVALVVPRRAFSLRVNTGRVALLPIFWLPASVAAHPSSSLGKDSSPCFPHRQPDSPSARSQVHLRVFAVVVHSPGLITSILDSNMYSISPLFSHF